MFGLLFATNFWDKIANWYSHSALRDWLIYLDEQVFGVNLEGYEGISVGSIGLKSLIFAIAFGFILASACVFYTRAVPGGLVRKMLKAEMFSSKEAKTLFELGYFRSFGIRRDLISGGSLRKVVRFVREDEKSPEDSTPFVPNLLSDRLYIPENLKYRAELRFRSSGSDLLAFLGACVLALLFAYFACKYLPSFLSLTEKML